jgi:hypothetical protein
LLDDVHEIRAKFPVADIASPVTAKKNVGMSKAINKGPGVDAAVQVYIHSINAE